MITVDANPVRLEPDSIERQRNDNAVQAFPIFVGISGKRNIDEKYVATVKKRIAQTLSRLDAEFPHVPKVLLTGAAYGADTIPMDLILSPGGEDGSRFGNWSVVMVLPYEPELYRKDFQPGPDAEDAEKEIARKREARFVELLGAGPRVKICQLPALRTDNNGFSLADRLDRLGPHSDRRLRHEHYEQVGQFIADMATILIAVTDLGGSPELDHANGNTERVVAYRRAGRPDALGADVAQRSDVLRKDWGTLVAPPGREVWLVEPKNSAPCVDGYAVRVLPAAQDAQIPASDHVPQGMPTAKGQRALIERSLVVPQSFEKLNAALAKDGHRDARIDMRGIEDPVGEITKVRTTLSSLQTKAKRLADNAFRVIAGLFVGDIFFLELFEKLTPSKSWLLMVYLGLFLVTLGVILFASLRRWQPIAEDYRALNEMLRVQRTWWAAGIATRVDGIHLQSDDDEAARVRESAGAIINWVALRSNWTVWTNPNADWSLVRGTETKPRHAADLARQSPRDWIGSQISYFFTHYESCHRVSCQLSALTWALFSASGWLAAVLWNCLRTESFWFPFSVLGALAVDCADTTLARVAISLPLLLPAIFVLALWRWLAGRIGTRSEIASRNIKIASIAVGLLVALALTPALRSFAALLPQTISSQDALERVTMIAFVLLSAIAGATQYCLDKLNFEPQSIEYRDMLALFERAERLMAAEIDNANGIPADRVSAKRLVLDLAKLALRENEAWLKARRERPLSPVIG